MADWGLSEELLFQLREMADKGASVKDHLEAIRSDGSFEFNSLMVIVYFKQAFFLNLRDIRMVEGTKTLGGAAYTDEEVDRHLLPLIEANRDLWMPLINK